MKAQQRWQHAKQKYEALALRERALLFGALLAGLYLLAELLVFGPLSKAYQLAEANERIAKQSLATTEAEIEVLQGLAKRDPHSVLQQEADALQQKLNQLDSRLHELSTGLVSAKQLPLVLQDLLEKSEKLRLLESHTLPVEEVTLGRHESASSATVTDPQLRDIKVYRHGVALKVEGGYMDIYRFLLAVEASEWQFYWEQMKYRVVRYPTAVVWLNVFTLSPELGAFNGFSE